MGDGVEPAFTAPQVDTLMRVLRAVSTHHERIPLFTAIADALHGVLSHDYPFIVLAGPGPDEMVAYYTHPPAPNHHQRLTTSRVRRNCEQS
jgi:hypothetical protein